MQEIVIPEIFEEDIIEFVVKDSKAMFKYYCENNIVELIFKGVYQFDFCEFDYINDIDWKFGLLKYSDSSTLRSIFARLNKEKKERACGGDYKKIHHYKLTIDDVGMYNFICKDFEIKQYVN